jgi:hypothetical protein
MEEEAGSFRALRNKKRIVFEEDNFGIFSSHEAIMPVDVPVHKAAKEPGVTRAYKLDMY